jgi:heterodisulfide reductase subunit B
MNISYYPGCTLKNEAKNFEDSSLFVMNHLGINAQEISRWNCCGTVFSLATDDIMHHLAPIRNLIRVKEANSDRVVTLCAMCYNTLKRANERIKNDPESLEKLNNFMSREKIKYQGDVKIFHLLELLRDEVKFDAIRKKVIKNLNGLRVANYYGCFLIRPREIGLDEIENPTVLEELTELTGAKPVDFPFKTECCGAYQTVDKPEMVAERTFQILQSAQKQGAEVVTVSCPLCAFNLDHRQKITAQHFPEFKTIPILYFTQLLALAFGCSQDIMHFSLHYVDPRPVLKEKKLI